MKGINFLINWFFREKYITRETKLAKESPDELRGE